MPNVDWGKIRAEYIAGGISQRALAEKHGISYATLRRRAKDEEWLKQRENCEREYNAKVAQKIASQRVNDLRDTHRIAHKALRKIEMELDSMLKRPGTSLETSTGSQKDKRVGMSQNLANIVNSLATVARILGTDAASERLQFDRERLALERERFQLDHGTKDNVEEINAGIVSLAELINHPMPNRSIDEILSEDGENDGNA